MAYEHYSTVVSLMPIALSEEKPGLRPPRYHIPAAARGDFNILHIPEATYAYYIDHHRGSLTLPEKSEIVARSIVADYIRSSILHTEEAYPGLFWVPGKLEKEAIKTLHHKELAEARAAQDAWCNILVRAADDSWRIHHRNSAVSDVQRAAARYLGARREWLEEIRMENTTECQFCTSVISARATVCPVCRKEQNESKRPAVAVNLG